MSSDVTQLHNSQTVPLTNSDIRHVLVFQCINCINGLFWDRSKTAEINYFVKFVLFKSVELDTKDDCFSYKRRIQSIK